ncbi:MAG: hypothetical protein AB8B68_05990 [Rickettsiaceae bacterium]
MQNEAFNFEVQRKTFHLYGLIFPLAYSFSSKMTASICLLIITGVTLYIDISRHRNQKIKEVVDKFFYKYLRNKEKNNSLSLSGASYMALGLLISCIFFSKGLAITSWFILIISDCVAALIGIKYGIPLQNGKSLFGAGAFFISSIFISIFAYFFISHNTSFTIIIFSSAVATLAEFYADQIKVNDNLSIPLSYCTTTVILGLIL